jgi:predicted transcriptional regulator
MITFEELKEKLLKDKEFKEEYDRLKPEYDLIGQLIKKRLKKGMTQKDVAKKMGTKQAAVSRMESGLYNSSINRYCQYADAVGSKIEINLK